MSTIIFTTIDPGKPNGVPALQHVHCKNSFQRYDCPCFLGAPRSGGGDGGVAVRPLGSQVAAAEEALGLCQDAEMPFLKGIEAAVFGLKGLRPGTIVVWTVGCPQRIGAVRRESPWIEKYGPPDVSEVD